MVLKLLTAIGDHPQVIRAATMSRVDANRDTIDDVSSTPEQIVVIVLAYHHSSTNIASLRYSGWIKYMDPLHYDFHVLSSDYHHTALSQSPVMPSKRSGLKSAAWSLATAFLPFVLGKVRAPSNIWLAAAIREGLIIASNARQSGKRCVILASYSPIEALIAASYLSRHCRLPYWADLRDGLTFETRGRGGYLFNWLRRIIEKSVLKGSSVISSVSFPICEHYAAQFPEKVVELLPNGFDPAIRASMAASPSAGDDLALPTHSIRYFGRVSLSDSSSFNSLSDFIEIYDEVCRRNPTTTLRFMGDFTSKEVELITDLQSNAVIEAPVSRSEAHQLMGLSDSLLLLTGTRSGTVTGKIFEYLAAGKRIIVFSQTENAAVKILRDIGDDDFIYVHGSMTKEEAASALVACLARPFKRSVDRLHLYDKRQQASKVGSILERLASQTST